MLSGGWSHVLGMYPGPGHLAGNEGWRCTHLELPRCWGAASCPGSGWGRGRGLGNERAARSQDNRWRCIGMPSSSSPQNRCSGAVPLSR